MPKLDGNVQVCGDVKADNFEVGPNGGEFRGVVRFTEHVTATNFYSTEKGEPVYTLLEKDGIEITEGPEGTFTIAGRFYLNDLKDVFVPGPIDCDVLTFNEALGLWIAQQAKIKVKTAFYIAEDIKSDRVLFGPEFYITKTSDGEPVINLNISSDIIANLREVLVTGGVANLGANKTNIVSWGTSQAVEAAPEQLVDGKVIAIQAALSKSRTAGTAEVQVLLNGVAQVGAGETVVLDGVNPLTISEFIGPIEYNVGDTVTAQVVTTGFSPANASITVWMTFQLDAV